MNVPGLSYIKRGKGISLLFQHGLGANNGQVSQLFTLRSGFELITFDAPGHGKSTLRPEQEPSFDFYTDTAIQLLDELGIQSAVFGGISMGSGIALNAALRYPERVMGLILVRPAWLDKPVPENLKILLNAADLVESGEKNKFLENPEFQNIQKVYPAAADSVLGVFSPGQQEAIPQVLRAMVNDHPFTSMKELQSIDKPCVVIGSNDDPLHPYAMAEFIHENIGNSTLHKVISRYINDSKHKEEVTRHIEEFVKQHEESLER